MRRAVVGDWPAIEALLRESGLPVVGARDHLDDFIVAGSDQVLGCVGLEKYANTGLLRSLAVSPTQRGNGLGHALVDACLTHARAAGITTLVLLTETAEPFFARLGFRRVDRASLPGAVQASGEFRGVCPASAVAMLRRLDRPDPLIRAAESRDLDAVAAIYTEGIRGRGATFETRDRTAADIASWLGVASAPLLVAEQGGRVVGWTRAHEYRPRAWYGGIREYSVYVAADAQRQGVGDALMGALIKECERLGYTKLVTRIFPENVASRSLCARHGFREVGVYERHGELDGVWRDVVIVERLMGRAAG